MKFLLISVLLILTTFTFGDARKAQITIPDDAPSDQGTMTIPEEPPAADTLIFSNDALPDLGTITFPEEAPGTISFAPADPDTLIFSDDAPAFPYDAPAADPGTLIFSDDAPAFPYDAPAADPDTLIFSNDAPAFPDDAPADLGTITFPKDTDNIIFPNDPSPVETDGITPIEENIFEEADPATVDPDILIFADGPTTDPVPVEDPTLDPVAIVFPSPIDPDILIFEDGPKTDPAPVEDPTLDPVAIFFPSPIDSDILIFDDGPKTDPAPVEDPKLDPGAIVFPAPIFKPMFLSGINFQSINIGLFTFLIDLRYLMQQAKRSKRSLPQAEQDENTQYKKVMIGHDLYRRFTIAHTVSDYQETIFTENVKPIDVKHLTKIMEDGSEYHRYSAGEEQIEVVGILLPEDQQPKKEAVECIQTEPLPCVKTMPMPKRGNRNPKRRPNSNGKPKPNIAIKKPTRSISFKNGAARKKRPEDCVKPKTNSTQ